MQRRFAVVIVLLSCAVASPLQAIDILVDYTYDTQDFFNTPEKRAAVEAAANRWAAVINSELLAIDASYDSGNSDWRVGFTHPGTGVSGYQISTASGTGTDSIYAATMMMNAADVYDPSFALPENTWILFAGGRSLPSAAVGGTGSGTNFSGTVSDPFGPHRRGLGVTSLPVWGGSISFDNDGSTLWHFDTSLAAPGATVDLYSIALHEIGHALGLSLSYADFTNHVSGNQFNGANALAAYNADNVAALTGLNLVDADNPTPNLRNYHWQDGTYESFIFAGGNPNYVGTVGEGVLQDLMMEPIANFTGSIRRLELTNVDVGAAEDVGWSIVPEPSTYVLGIIGMVILGFVGWRKRPRTPKS